MERNIKSSIFFISFIFAVSSSAETPRTKFFKDTSLKDKCVAIVKVKSCVQINGVKLNVQRAGRYNQLTLTTMNEDSSSLCSNKMLRTVKYGCNRYNKQGNCFVKYGLIPTCPQEDSKIEAYIYKNEDEVILADYSLIK